MLFKSTDIGIDLGTATVLIYIKGKGIVLREPTVVAIDRLTGKVQSVGLQAQKMLGKTPENITAVRPLKDGVISDYDVTMDMLQHFLRKAIGTGIRLKRPRVVVCVPSGVTDVERRAVDQAIYETGARFVAIEEEPKAAALGAGLDINAPKGCMVIDIGGGTTDVAVISLGSCVVSKSLKLAGDRMNEDIVKYVKKKHNLLIGERTAELLKINIGTAYPRKEILYAEVMGRNLLTGLPKSITLSSDNIMEALQDCIEELAKGVHSVLENTPPELAADIFDRGIVMTGGGAQLFGLDKLFSERFKVTCYVAEDPASCVALGTGHFLENLDYADPQSSKYKIF